MKKNSACLEDNMHDKEEDIRSFLHNIFTGHEFDALPGGLAMHDTPRSLEELADALKPRAEPCPDWMKAY